MDWDDGGTELVEAYGGQRTHDRRGVLLTNAANRRQEREAAAGQERFRSVTRSYYRGAAGAILVYDITSRSTFEGLTKWLEDIRALASDHIEIVLVGNKLDLAEDREVETEEGERFARDNTRFKLNGSDTKLTPDLTFIETSSLTGENAALPFHLAARSILAGIDQGNLDPDSAGSGISYGERQLRAVADTNTPRIFRRRRRDSISIREFVGAKDKCAC
ncbi:hypothetical protein A1Q2_05187 [Trichosporon asahii var. asahii CBS 8904]|uniref:Uncharacterized protein n=1 Tax=Trichosporon asahii var. asahii (strain CBS 8904) TaxID=1220162 RepID=K1VMC3_TRIAC|nr:hypothetical protein A1Q2_05187 [Trichosporon asahii var. asahii CBS 8904]